MAAASSPTGAVGSNVPRRAGVVHVRACLALGVTLARRGPMAAVSMAISVLTAIALAVVGVAFATRGGEAPVHDVPLLASSAIAWGGGFLHAVSTAASAFRRDRAAGIRHLFRARATSMRGYLVARVGGLAVLLFAAVGGGTLLTGVVSILGSTRASGLPRTVQATVASLAFAFAFSVVVAPVAFAALGARSRASGYLALLAILIVPEMVASMATGPLPSEVTELCALPSALAALRSSLAPGSVDAFRCVRAIVALTLFASVAMFFVRRDVVLLEREPEAQA